MSVNGDPTQPQVPSPVKPSPAGPFEFKSQISPKEGKVRRLEFLVFLFLVVPSLLASFYISKLAGLGFPLIAAATILRDLALVALLLFFLWRNGEKFRSIGLTLKSAWLEALLGVALFVPVFMSAAALQVLFRSAGLSGTSLKMRMMLVPHGIGEYILAFVLVCVVAFSEELIFRGYVIKRLGLFVPWPAAVVPISVLVFTLGHAYEGIAGLMAVFYLGLVYAVVYVWRKSLVAPMVMHFLQDFGAIVLLPLLLHWK